MTQQNNRLGILTMCLAAVLLAVQDGLSRHMGSEYNVLMIVMIRYWFFAGFVTVFVMRQAGGLRHAVIARHPRLQLLRGLLLPFSMMAAIKSFVLLGLVQTHAISACYPLLIAALSGPVLGEKVGWRRWSAIIVGLFGVLIILKPGFQTLKPAMLLPLLSISLFAFYILMTRFVSRKDNAATSFFWGAIPGAVVMTFAGLGAWEPIGAADWGWMVLLGAIGTLAQFILIKTYEMAEVGVVQPFAYLQIVVVVIIGVTIFDETVQANVIIGAAIAIGAALFTLWRERVTAR